MIVVFQEMKVRSYIKMNPDIDTKENVDTYFKAYSQKYRALLIDPSVTLRVRHTLMRGNP
jgi:hypothetical protein